MRGTAMWTNAARQASNVTVTTSCGTCGRPVKRMERTLWRPARCDVCKAAYHRELCQARREKEKAQRKAVDVGRPGETSIEIVCDPDPAGGFRAGARIHQKPEMLDAGSFTPGTLLRDRGRLYRVIGAAGRPQTLELVK